MKKAFSIFILILTSYLGFGQKATEADCKKNQQVEKEIIVNNKLTKIEVVQYSKNKNWNPISKNIYYFNSDGCLIKRENISIFNGDEKVTWTGNYFYNTYGLCDSVPTDKGYRKVINCKDKYPACYWHLDTKKLKDGLTLIIKPQIKHMLPAKVVYYFKRE